MPKMEFSFRPAEVVENKQPPDCLKNIKPETPITMRECRDFLKEKFQSEIM